MKIAFIGSGFMAGAMMDGIVKGGVAKGEDIFAVNEAFPESAEEAAKKYGVIHAAPEDIKKCDVVVFGVKPQVFDEAVTMYGEYFTPDKLYLSIMAGISTARLESVLHGARVVRFMPNLALSVGKSATAYCLGSKSGEAEANIAETIFSPLGIVKRVDEDMIGTVTALSGSGPAYFCRLCEAMADSAVKLGMDPDTARELAVQTLLGTAKIIGDTGVSPDELRVRVTSKKGTTEAALNAMTETKFDESVDAAVRAAKQRSDELGK